MEITPSVKTPLSQTNVKSQKSRIFLLLSFGIPMLFLAAGFVLQNVHPFGDQQILVVDFWHQYYPFLRLLHENCSMEVLCCIRGIPAWVPTSYLFLPTMLPVR